MQEKYHTLTIHSESELKNIPISLCPGDRIFFFGDLGVGKTTLIRTLIRRFLHDESLIIRSPTYIYYQQYGASPPIYHFDLYRLENPEAFIALGGEEIAENPESIMLIEWPEILEGYIEPTMKVSLSRNTDDTRHIEIFSSL